MTENHGVPGSNPGPATQESPANRGKGKSPGSAAGALRQGRVNSRIEKWSLLGRLSRITSPFVVHICHRFLLKNYQAGSQPCSASEQVIARAANHPRDPLASPLRKRSQNDLPAFWLVGRGGTSGAGGHRRDATAVFVPTRLHLAGHLREP